MSKSVVRLAEQRFQDLPRSPIWAMPNIWRFTKLGDPISGRGFLRLQVASLVPGFTAEAKLGQVCLVR